LSEVIARVRIDIQKIKLQNHEQNKFKWQGCTPITMWRAAAIQSAPRGQTAAKWLSAVGDGDCRPWRILPVRKTEALVRKILNRQVRHKFIFCWHK
jgi:hypothetical protein